MARLAIMTLGALQITLDAVPLTGFDSDKARALLTYLAVESHRPHHRDHLVGLFWPTYPELRARHTLSQALFSVRQVIGDQQTRHHPPFLAISRQTLQFDRSSDYWLDVEQFTTLPPPQHPDPQSVLARCAEAVAVYRGDFLEGFSHSESSAFEEWLLLQREHWQRITLATFTRLIEGYAHIGAYEKALHFAWQQLDLDPWREDTHRHIMHLLVLNGQPSAALAQYETCRAMLRDELGVTPEAQTTALCERIKAGAMGEPERPVFTTLLGVAAPGAAVSGDSLPNNLPAHLTPFIGRKAELAAIMARLHSSDCRLLALIGPGGIGKTRLALAAARQSLPDFPHGVYLVPLVALQAPESLLPALAAAIGLALKPGQDVQQRLHSALRDRKILLILDNFEHLLAGLELLLQLLEATAHLKILLTSRIVLKAQAASVFLVPGLELPATAADAATAASSDAVQLFVSGATRACGAFALTAETLPDVVEICRLVQGLPLALLLITAWLPVLSLGAIRARLAAEPKAAWDLLCTTWQDLPERHRSLQAVFDHSWHLLTIREQAVFQALAVFWERFTRAAALEVTGVTLPELRSLIAKCCVQLTPTGHYEIHPLLRQYAAAKLEQHPEVWHEVHARRSAYYAAKLQQWAVELQGADQQNAWRALELESANAQRAWHWSVVEGRVAELALMLPAIGVFHAWSARYAMGLSACQLAAERLEQNAAPEAREVRALALAWMGRFHWLAGRPLVATSALNRSHEVLETLDPTSAVVGAIRAFVLLQRGDIAMGHDRELALQHYRGSLALYRQADQRWGQSRALTALGWWGWHTSNLVLAREHLEAGLELAREAGDIRTMVWAITGLSGVAMTQGHFEEAARLAEECLALRRELGDLLEIAEGLYSLGIKQIALGQFEAARTLLEGCISIHRNHFGVPDTLALSMASWTLMFMGFYQEAHPLAKTALQRMQQAGNQRGVGWVAHVLGSIELALGNVSAALELSQTSISAYRHLGQRLELGFALGISGWAHCRLHQFSEAQRELVEALQIALETSGAPALSFAIPGIALLLASQGHSERAIELYALAEGRFPTVRQSPWYADLVGAPIMETAAALSPEMRTATQARGRARDLWHTAAELLDEFHAG